MIDEITALVLTFNEAPNIERTLTQLQWAKRIVMVDSYSTDETLAIAGRFQRVEILRRRFDSFADQCNFGLSQIRTPWVLSLDADYVLTEALNREIAALNPATDVMGFRAAFNYCVCGRTLRASLYPPRIVLYRKDCAQYENDGHGHRVRVHGRVEALQGIILHDDRKPLSRWLAEQSRYAAQEADKLMMASSNELNFPDRVRRKIVFAPMLVFFYTLFIKRLVLDGFPGWHYAFQRVVAELILSLRLIERRFERSVSGAH